MTSFHCKKCGTSVNGVGPEQRWTCPKCKNVALREQLEKLADQDSINEKELIKSNKMLLKCSGNSKGSLKRIPVTRLTRSQNPLTKITLTSFQTFPKRYQELLNES